MSEELLREVRITHVMDCLADPNKIRVLAEFSCDISEALPYLATLLPRSGYNHAARILMAIEGGRLLSVFPHTVSLAKASDEEDAQAVLEWLRRLINEAWARRGEITPCLERRAVPRLFDVYALLPRQNCARCGEATCVALAAGVIFGERRVTDCPLLADEAFARNRRILVEWLG